MVVLLLALAAGGALVGSVIANHPEWAWLSVLLCVVGAALLVVDRVRRRRDASSSTGEPSTTGDEQPRQDGDADSPEASDRPEAETVSSGEPVAERTASMSGGPGADPGEEDTDAADSIVVSELADEVVVLDERPRYHLATCEWLGGRSTIPLPVNEARELGFTACARCSPNATLAARQRASS